MKDVEPLLNPLVLIVSGAPLVLISAGIWVLSLIALVIMWPHVRRIAQAEEAEREWRRKGYYRELYGDDSRDGSE